MKLIWKSIIVSSISLLLAIMPVQVVNSCSTVVGDEEIRISLFNPFLSDNEGLASFYYNLDYSILDEEVNPKRDYIRNCEEWRAQFEDSVSVEDIYNIMYETSLDSMLNAFEDSTWQNLYPSNTFVKAISKPQHLAKLDYFKLIIKLEFSHFADTDPWGFGNYDYYTSGYDWQSIANEIEKISFNIEPFLKERYGYQLVMLHYYLNNSNECIAAFDNHLKNSSSILKAWGNIYKASALYRIDKKEESTLALAHSFYACDSKKKRATQLIDREYLDTMGVELAKTKEEKVAIYAFKSTNYPAPALEYIQKIADIEPDYDYLALLIQREINKLENWLLTPYLSGELTDAHYSWSKDNENGDFESLYQNGVASKVNYNIKNASYSHKNYQKDLEYLRKFRQLLIQLVPKRTDKDFLNLAIAHLYILDFKPTIAKSYINKVNINASETIKSQVYIQRILEKAQTKNINSKAVQEELANMLIWLYGHQSVIGDAERTLSQLNLYLSRCFYKKGNIPIAGLLYALTNHTHKGGGGRIGGYYNNILMFDKYATLADMDVVLQLFDKKSKTKFEEYLIYIRPIWDSEIHYDYNFNEKGALHDRIRRTTDVPQVSKIAPQKFQVLVDTFAHDLEQMLWDVKGTIAFRQDKLGIAYESWANSAFDYRNTSRYSDNDESVNNPFNDRWIKFETGEEKEPQKYQSKEAIVERLINLKKESSPDSLYVLGKAYHSFTYWGRNWKMFNYGKYDEEWMPMSDYGQGSFVNYTFYPNSETYENEYYKLSRAKKYFQQALNHPKANLDLKARALFMLGECDRRQNDWIHLKSGKDEKKKYISPYQKRLERDYKKAKLYHTYISCSNGG